MSLAITSRRHWAAAIALSLCAAATAALPAAAAPAVDVSIEPAQISLGESARLTILRLGNGTLSVPLPVVSGLEFRIVGQSQRIQIINGTTLESTMTIVRVTPEEAGVFTIPGLTPNSPPLVLRVTPSGSAGAAPVPGAPSPAPLGGLAGANSGGVRLTPDGSAFVYVELPKREVFVGESIPVEIQVGMRDGFVESLNGLPKLNSNDFTLNNLSRQPERARRTIEAKPFTVYTWHSVLAAVKPGTYSLAFETPLTVRIRTRPQREWMLDDLLGDPFMQNIFGATVQKNVNASSPAADITVLPLPAQGRPPDFGGAVGSFKISTDLSTAMTTAGDPLTLRMHVSGAGNFDRVESSMLGGDAEWKTYEPKASFNAADPTGYRGEKTFEQPIIASQPGSRTIPPLSFAYFDPATRQYETAHSAPLSVMVAPAPNNPATEPTPAGAAPTADAAHSGLKPDHAVTEARVASLMPLYFRPGFAAGASVLALILAGGWAALRRRERNANDLERERERRRLQITQALLQEMAAAAGGGDTATFFRCARSALQQTWSARSAVAPALLTADDIEAGLQGEDHDAVRQIFALADEANYSGAPLRAADFEHWTQVVRRLLTGQPA
jgi:hypothetical protein